MLDSNWKSFKMHFHWLNVQHHDNVFRFDQFPLDLPILFSLSFFLLGVPGWCCFFYFSRCVVGLFSVRYVSFVSFLTFAVSHLNCYRSIEISGVKAFFFLPSLALSLPLDHRSPLLSFVYPSFLYNIKYQTQLRWLFFFYLVPPSRSALLFYQREANITYSCSRPMY